MIRVGKSFVKSLDKGVGFWLSRPFSDEVYRRFFWGAMGLFVVLWLCHVWLNDDALLTFRQVLNFTEGHGVVWNWGERVQVFTHPSWFLLLSVAHVLSGGLFEPNILKYSSLFVSLALCMGALWLFLREMQGLQKGVVVALLLALLSSQAFIDYTSSGLENPLSYFLVALISIRFFSARYDGFFFLACALLFLNRMDYALLLLPLCLYAWRSCGYKFSVVLPALSLCLLWLVFATWYFGYPFPNTLLAKRYVDAPLLQFLIQGLSYYKITLLEDPVSLFVIFFVVFFSLYIFWQKRRIGKISLLGLGLSLYGLYLLLIGGDNMSGRFFAAPFFFALCGLGFFFRSNDFKKQPSNFSYRARIAGVGLLFFVLLSCFSTFQKIRMSFLWSHWDRIAHVEGITRTRFHYASWRYLLTGDREWINSRRDVWSFRFIDLVSFSDKHPLTINSSGPNGYYGARGILSMGDKYLVDTLALGSPYLSRVRGNWNRIGHMVRAIPTDFEPWVLGWIDSMPAPRLTALFSDIRNVTRGRLFSWNRLKKIVKINLLDYKIESFPLWHERKPRLSQFHHSLREDLALSDLPFVEKNLWGDKSFPSWLISQELAQSIALSFDRKKIKRIALLVSDIKEYSWSLYDGQKKIHEDSYKTDKYHSVHTFILPKAMIADRLEIIVKKGGDYRRIARPLLE